MNVKQVYSGLLRLYPRDYRAVFAAEMLAVFDEAAEERMRQGWAGYVRFTVGELAGLLSGAGREWLANWTYGVRHSNSYITGRGLPDRLFMRPAGISWESYYGAQASRIGVVHPDAERRAHLNANSGTGHAGSLRVHGGEARACLNAHQRFEFSSTLRRLLLLAFGDSCQCKRRMAQSQLSELGRGRAGT